MGRHPPMSALWIQKSTLWDKDIWVLDMVSLHSCSDVSLKCQHSVYSLGACSFFIYSTLIPWFKAKEELSGQYFIKLTIRKDDDLIFYALSPNQAQAQREKKKLFILRNTNVKGSWAVPCHSESLVLFSNTASALLPWLSLLSPRPHQAPPPSSSRLALCLVVVVTVLFLFISFVFLGPLCPPPPAFQLCPMVKGFWWEPLFR